MQNGVYYKQKRKKENVKHRNMLILIIFYIQTLSTLPEILKDESLINNKQVFMK